MAEIEREAVMNIALWILQSLLAFAFGMAGNMKAFSYEKFKKQAGDHAPSKNLAFFIGLSASAAAVGFIPPWETAEILARVQRAGIAAPPLMTAIVLRVAEADDRIPA